MLGNALSVALTTLIVYGIASAWHTTSMGLIGKPLGLSVGIVLCLFMLGELTRGDLAFMWSLLRREQAFVKVPEEDSAMGPDPAMRSSTHVPGSYDSNFPRAG